MKLNLIAVLIAISQSLFCQAAVNENVVGKSLFGKMPDGRIATADNSSRHIVQISKEGADFGDGTFLDEPCKLTYEKGANSIEDRIYTFSCASTGISPFAGTKYVGRFVKGDCVRGSNAYHKYECVSGCQNNPHAPHTLVQEHWICGGNKTDIQKAFADAAAKTITPGMVKEIERKYTKFCEPSENPAYVENRKATLAVFSPAEAVINELRYRHGIMVVGDVRTVIMKQPTHGTLRSLGSFTNRDLSAPYNVPYEMFEYIPNHDFLGDDNIDFSVTVNGTTFRIGFMTNVMRYLDNEGCNRQQR